MKKTPPIYAKGRYQLNTPYSLDDLVLHTCIAIRSFGDIYEQGKDVFTLYYEPHGLTEEDVANDEKLRANIITLMSEDDDVIYVPDTYILSYPDMGTINYQHLVVSASLGAVPETLPLEFLQNQIHSTVLSVLGIESEVNIHKAPSVNVISPEDHEVLEVARLSALSLQKTERARIIELENTNTRLQQEIAILTDICQENDLF